MAYIPDEAVDESAALTPAAFKLYCLICRRRDHFKGSANVSTASASTMLQINLGTARRAFAELINLSWIARNANVAIPLKGDFSPVNRSAERRARQSAPSAQIGAQSARECAPSAQNSARPYIDSPASYSSSDYPASSSSGVESLQTLGKWTAEAKRAHNELPSGVVELGVLKTLLARPADAEPIRSVNYFTPEILEHSKQPLFIDEGLTAAIVESYKRRYLEWTNPNF